MSGKPIVLAAGVLAALALWACGAAPGDAPARAPVHPKIAIDLSQLDDNGLRGPADGKVAMAYEFAIPDTPAARAEVAAIDPTVRFMPGSRGRIGARPGQCLCIGSTHQKDFRKVLERLAALEYIERIQECFFE